MKAVDALLTGLVDYAGLFPPASQDMKAAIECYAAYMGSADRYILGRFILPLSRLAEFETVGTDYLPHGPESEPWRLSVILAADATRPAEEILLFNRRHWSGSEIGNAIIEVIELKVAEVDEIRSRNSKIPAQFLTYVEFPIEGNIEKFVRAIADRGLRAKLRTGGTTAEAFPRAESIVRFLTAARAANIRFKATAGLHHPVRGRYPLTYENDSDAGTMFGYVNLFVAAALIYRGDTEQLALDCLHESDASAFVFSDFALEWGGVEITAEELATVRENFANSFGSCSFREPVDEIRELTTLAQL